jgi:recombinational DNA repair ATPase RecF
VHALSSRAPIKRLRFLDKHLLHVVPKFSELLNHFQFVPKNFFKFIESILK